MDRLQASTDGSAPASNAKDGLGVKSSLGVASKPTPPSTPSQNSNQNASTKPSASSRPAQPGGPKPSASVRPSPASGQGGAGSGPGTRPTSGRAAQQPGDVKQRMSGSGSVQEPVTVDDDADSPKEQPPESSAMVISAVTG